MPKIVLVGHLLSAWEAPYDFQDRGSGERVVGVSRKALVQADDEPQPVEVKFRTEDEFRAATGGVEPGSAITWELRSFDRGKGVFGRVPVAAARKVG